MGAAEAREPGRETAPLQPHVPLREAGTASRGPGMPGGRGPRQGSGKTVDRAPGEEVARKREAQDTASETQSRLSLSLHREPWKRRYGAGREQLPGPSSFGKPVLSRQWPRCSGEGRPPIPVCAPTSQQGFHGYEGEGLDTHTCATDWGRTLPCSSEQPLGPWPVPQTGTFSRAHFAHPTHVSPMSPPLTSLPRHIPYRCAPEITAKHLHTHAHIHGCVCAQRHACAYSYTRVHNRYAHTGMWAHTHAHTTTGLEP